MNPRNKRPSASLTRHQRLTLAFSLLTALNLAAVSVSAQSAANAADPNGGSGVDRGVERRKGGGQGNKPEREHWFMDLGFCM